MARYKPTQLAKEPIVSQETKLRLEGGATRTNDVLIRYDLIPPVVLDVLGTRFTVGMLSHGANNWKQGGVDFILSCFARYEHHKSKLVHGSEDDDLGAMIWNVSVLAWFRKFKPEEYKAAIERMR